MKVLVDANGVVKYAGHVYVQKDDVVEARDEAGNLIFVVCDMNIVNSEVVEGVEELPKEFTGNKFKVNKGTKKFTKQKGE